MIQTEANQEEINVLGIGVEAHSDVPVNYDINLKQ